MSENQLNVANNVSFSSDYYINKNISEIVMNYIKTNDNNNNNNIKKVFAGVGMIIVAEITKTVIIDFLKEQKKQMNEGLINILKEISIFPTLVWTIKLPFRTLGFTYNLLLNKYYNLFCPRFEEKLEIIKNDVCFEIESNQLFISNLIRYIETNEETCKYNKIYDNKITVEKNNIDNEIKYNDIDINFEDINIIINRDIKKSRDKCIIENITYENIFEKIVEEYLSKDIVIDFIDSNGSIYCCQYTINFSKIVFKICNHDYIYFEENPTSLIYGDYIFKLCVNKYIKDVIKSLKLGSRYFLDEKIKNVLLIAASISNEFTKNKSYYEKIDIIKKIYNNDKINLKINLKISDYGVGFHETILENQLRFTYGYKTDYNKLLSNSKYKNFFENLAIDNTVSNVNNLEFIVKLLNNNKGNTIDKNYLNKQVKKFILEINNLSLQSSSKNKIKIYTLKIENKKSNENIPNPKYEKYINEKKKLLEENKEIKTETIINLLGIEPEKEFIEEHINKEIKMDLVNERYTSFDNLYLSKEQDRELYELYNSFENDKKENEELGIPNKLCILLHGEPGTGKTTTIITTASHFGKDIFYISLKNISNNDLKIMFDYINDKHVNQGIIIFEDFDAMTSVVMDRKTNINKSLIDTLDDTDNENLTLDYFLNVLDGTLTREGSIIIMTTNHIEKIDPAIYRAGRVDKKIEMKKSDHYQISKIFKRFIKRDINPDVLKRIKEYIFTPAEIIFKLKEYVKRRNESDEEILKDFLLNN